MSTGKRHFSFLLMLCCGHFIVTSSCGKKLSDHEGSSDPILDIIEKHRPPDLEIEIFAEQFQWTARYPGSDKILGPANYKFIDSVNVLGIDYSDSTSADDFITDTNEKIHFPVGRELRLIFRSKDVIHGAYFPAFRMQMNVVPGLKTKLDFTAKLTTKEIRKISPDLKFPHMLLCNKICGEGHSGMIKEIIVEEEADFIKWFKKKQNDNR